jgi:SAM-dependent methyltransferase
MYTAFQIVRPKYPRYQDYVIKDGHFVGEFEQMYRDYDDPWRQTVIEKGASDKAVALHLMRKLDVTRVLDLGCGLGHFTQTIADAGFRAMGVDISTTAIDKARLNYPACEFRAADILDLDIYREFRPDLIVMAEITWYVLDKLDQFLEFWRSEFPDTYLIHLLRIYPPGEQKYGLEKFSTLPEVMKYFGLKYMEWGELHISSDPTTKSFFLGHW